MERWWQPIEDLRPAFVAGAQAVLGDRYEGDLSISQAGLGSLARHLDVLPTAERETKILDLGAGLSSLLFALWAKRQQTAGHHPVHVVTVDHDHPWLCFVESFAERHDLKLMLPTTMGRFQKTWWSRREFDLTLVDQGPTTEARLDELDWALFGTRKDGVVVLGGWFTGSRPSYKDRWTKRLSEALCHRHYAVWVDDSSRDTPTSPALAEARYQETDLEWAHNVTLEAELSRNDWLLLHGLCLGVSVVEVGSGGSTAMLGRITKHLVSYETDPDWFMTVRRELRRRGLSHVDYRKVGLEPDEEAPQADVYIIDCASPKQLRSRWLKLVESRRLAPTVLVHDSRRESPTNDLGWLFQWPRSARIESVDFHKSGSNYLVIRFREKPVRYVNWLNEPNRNPLKVIG